MLGTGDRTQERLGLLVRAGEMFHRSLEVDETLDNVARMAIESFSDLCLFDMIDEQSDRLYVTAGAHRDPSMDSILKNVGSSILYDMELGVHPAVRVFQSGVPFFVPVFDEHAIRLHAASSNHASFMRQMGYRSKIVVPVIAQQHIFGSLSFVRTTDTAPFDEQDVDAAQELGRRAGLAVANAKQFHREQHVAATLQRAFLTKDFPDRDGLSFDAIYRPSKGDAELGGDWYDAFKVADGSIVVTIGDVTGNGIEAARLMVQLRQSIRVAATIDADPGAILRIVNETALLDRADAIATAFVGTISPDGTLLRYASAGHPPAFLRTTAARSIALAGSSPPLGIQSGILFDIASFTIDTPATLVMYTDGLTESTRDAIAGEEALLAVLASNAFDFAASPALFVERAAGRDPSHDDVAIMTVRFGERATVRQWQVSDPGAAYTIKGSVLEALREVARFTAEQQETARLIFGELVGNAVRHAPGALSVSISSSDDKIYLHVIDDGPGFDNLPALPSDIWAESGRGLYLISALADELNVERLAGYGSHITVSLQHA